MTDSKQLFFGQDANENCNQAQNSSTKNISIIVAMDKNRVIGHHNQLPWHLPADLKHFKEKTLGKPIIMGRKTYESIGKVLPGRKNIILTSNQAYKVSNAIVAHSIADALKAAGNVDEIMIIGGVNVFKAFLPITHKIYLTYIMHEFLGDTFFPEINLKDWKEISIEEHESDEKNQFSYKFFVLESINVKK